jgi:hypothetical protein
VQLLSLALICGLSVPGEPATPDSALKQAAGDISKVIPALRYRIRYLTLYNVPEKNKEALIKVIAFQVNSLSTSGVITQPVKVGNDLLRLDIKKYEWDPGVWERFADIDPYFHIKVKFKEDVIESRYWPGGTFTDGKVYERKLYKIKVKAGQETSQHAPWLSTKEVLYLRQQTESEAPIIRADWFLFQTAIQADRVAGYYDFLKLGKKQADFEKLIGVNRKTSARVKREIAAILPKSGVTLKNRAITRFSGATGGYWVTKDYKKSTDKSNVIRFLDKDVDPPEGDASEQYGFLPNGLFAFWLQNDKGDRQDAAPDFIASDGMASGNDRKVHIGLSCIRCHVEGIKPINDHARKLYKGRIKLASTDDDKYERLIQLYLSDLDYWIKRDQDDYAKVLYITTKWKPAELAKEYSKAWDNYTEADLLPVDIARELGVREKQLINAVKWYSKLKGISDPVITGIIQEPALPMIRDHFEEIVPNLQEIIRGYLSK